MISPLFAAAAILGLNVHQSSTVGPNATKGAALGIVRIDANWVDCEKSQGQYDFTLFDQVVNAAQANNLAVLAVLGYGPAFDSSGDKLGDGSTNDIPKPGTYAAFVTAAVNHLKDRVTAYELWNEPNLQQFFEGTPQDYISNVLIPGADALHAACPTCLVVAPALATVGTDYATWLDAVLAAAKDKIDIVSGHDYAHFPQDSPGSGGANDSFYNKLESHRIVKIGTTIAYEGPLSFKEVMDAHGAKQPFWITETGIEATYGDTTQEATQTLYYRRVLESMLTRPWWQATVFYEAFDVPPPAQYHFGVCVDDSAASLGYDEKPVMAMLRKAAQNQPVFGGTGTDCNDGLDNDGDGNIDSADPDCAKGTNEGLPPVDAGTPDAGDVEMETAGGGGCNCNASGSEPSALLLIAMLALRRRRAR